MKKTNSSDSIDEIFGSMRTVPDLTDVVEIVERGERSIGRSQYGELQYRYVFKRNTVIQNVKDKRFITVFSDMPKTSKHNKGYKIPW